MRLGLLLVFAAVPFLEIALIIKVGQSIGFWPTLLLIVVSASFGSYLIYGQGFQVMGRAMEAMQRGKAPLAPVIDGLFILLAGVLLILPGFISDAVGLALLVPRVRHQVAVWTIRGLFRSTNLRTFFFWQHSTEKHGRSSEGGTGPSRHGPQAAPQSVRQPPGEGPIIEGEFERLDERTIDRGKGRDEDVRRDGRNGRNDRL